MSYCDRCRIAQEWPKYAVLERCDCDVCGAQNVICHGQPSQTNPYFARRAQQEKRAA